MNDKSVKVINTQSKDNNLITNQNINLAGQISNISDSLKQEKIGAIIANKNNNNIDNVANSASSIVINNHKLVVSNACQNEIKHIQKIYKYYVENSHYSMEEKAPSVIQMQNRFFKITKKHNLPYLVAKNHGKVVGFAYAAPWRERSAYSHTVESSIYISKENIGSGIGNLLMSNLIEKTKNSGKKQIIAVIAGLDNISSIMLHVKHGFEQMAVLPATAEKFGKTIDTIIMQKHL